MNAQAHALRTELRQTRLEIARAEQERDEAMAQYLVSLFGVEARHRLAGVVRTLEVENASTSVVPSGAHPICCDCEPCLNGDRDHV